MQAAQQASAQAAAARGAPPDDATLRLLAARVWDWQQAQQAAAQAQQTSQPQPPQQARPPHLEGCCWVSSVRGIVRDAVQVTVSTQADAPWACICLLHMHMEGTCGVGAQAHATPSLASQQVQLHTADYTTHDVSTIYEP